MRKRFVSLLVVTVILFLTGLRTVPALAQEQEPETTQAERWTAPYFFGYGWWQTPLLDRLGNVHTIYYTSKQFLDVLGYSMRRPDGTWTVPNDIFCPCVQGFTVRNAMTITSDGRLHVVYRRGLDLDYSSTYYSLAENAASWSKPFQIGSQSYYVDLLADRNDVLHIVYGQATLKGDVKFIEDDPCFLCSDIYYRRSFDGGKTWTEEINLSDTPGGSERMRLLEAASGRLYLYWSEGFDAFQTRGEPTDVRFIYSDDGGENWSNTIILDGGGDPNRPPTNLGLAEDRNGRLVAVWRYSNRLDSNYYYQLSTDSGLTWTKPEAIPGFVARDINENKYDNLDLQVDRLGTIHLFATGLPAQGEGGTNVGVYHAQFAQDLWFQANRVFFRDKQAPEWPRAVIGPRNDIHLTWFVRDNSSGNGSNASIGIDTLRLYYMYQEGILQPQPVKAFTPTETPPPTPTVFSVLEPTVTPFAIHNQELESVAITSRDTYAAQTLLGGTVLASIFCGLIAVVIRWRRRG